MTAHSVHHTITNRQVRAVLARLSGRKRSGQILDPIAFHPFPARMSLAVAEYLVAQLSAPGAIVLDPMVGSGTTVIAARNLGRIGTGFDRDPLAVTIAR